MKTHSKANREDGPRVPNGPEQEESGGFADLAARRLREFRAKLGWTQKEMAQRLQIDQQKVSAMERGANVPVHLLSRLQNYGLDIDSFLDVGSSDFEQGKDAVSTELDRLQSLHNGGIVETHPTRAAGLRNFQRYIEREHLQMDLTGSSLKGLFINREILDAILYQLRASSRLGLQILVTHPAFAVLRAFVEGRKPGAIRQEIEEAIDDYRAKLEEAAPGRVNVRVALHPPTVFALFLVGQGRALVNPYTLTIEAYSTQSLIIRDTGNQSCMYRQYHLHHFLNAWDSDQRLHRRVSVGLDLYKETLNGLLESTGRIAEALKMFESKRPPNRTS